jgi:hypothetical protein
VASLCDREGVPKGKASRDGALRGAAQRAAPQPLADLVAVVPAEARSGLLRWS